MILDMGKEAKCRHINKFFVSLVLLLFFISIHNIRVTFVYKKNYITFRKWNNRSYYERYNRTGYFVNSKYLLNVKKRRIWKPHTAWTKLMKERERVTTEENEKIEQNNSNKRMKEENDMIIRSADLVKHLHFNFNEECNDIIIRIGNFLEVSPQLLFKNVCVDLKKLYTNLYTNESINTPFGSTQHILDVNEDVIKVNKFKISCVLGLKVLRIFLIKYLRSIRLCIPPEVRKRYICDFLKIEYISKIYDETYNLVDRYIYDKLSDKLKSKLIYFYLSRNPYDVPNVLIKIFKAAGYTDESEVLYKYILKSNFTSRGGKRFHRIIKKEYNKLFAQGEKKEKSSEKDILWVRFLSVLKAHAKEILKERRILRNTYQFIFSPINLHKDKIVQLLQERGFQIFGPDESKLVENELNKNTFANREKVTWEKEPIEAGLIQQRRKEYRMCQKEIKNEKLKIGRQRKNCIFNFILNLKKFIRNYVRRTESVDFPFYLLKKNLHIPKNPHYDEIVCTETNIFHLANMNADPLNAETEHMIAGDTAITPYIDHILNMFLDSLIDILIENAGFKNMNTLLAIYKSLVNRKKEFCLIHFRNKI